MAPSKDKPVTGRDDTPTPSVTERGPTLTDAAAAAVPAQQALSLPLPAAGGHRPLADPIRLRQLWLCLHLPRLPLEAVGGDDESMPLAVFEDCQGVQRVLMANACAQGHGIAPGLSLNGALALASCLRLEARDPEEERRKLGDLAAWAERYTSRVSLEEPDSLLLEVAGSLKLFDGLDALRERIRRELRRQGHTATVTVAPTPLSTLWLARAGQESSIESVGRLAGALGPLPLRCLEWPAAVVDSLNGMGIYSVGDCLRLPRQGFARRFGATRLLALDRALGRLPDPRRSHRAPERFAEDYELIEEQSDSELLLMACRQLLARLERFLTSRQLAVRSLRFDFFHLREKATHLTLGCGLAGCSAAQWLELLALRFERLELPAPVILIRLQSGRTEALQAATEMLRFDGSKTRGQSSVTRLMERLGTRMGAQSLHGVTLVPEHRPHYVWKAVRPQPGLRPAVPAGGSPRTPRLLAEKARTEGLLLRRPLWMLREPEPLQDEEGRPVYRGTLRLLEGPERLETGWWDGKGIARDYYVAVNPRGMRLWIYRNRKSPAAWYLHGLFG